MGNDTDPASAARRVAGIFDKWSRPDHVRLHAGEMTAQEMRSVLAVLGAVRGEVEAAIALADAEAAAKRETQVCRVGRDMIAAMRAADNRYAGPEWREGKTDAIEAASAALDAAVMALARR